MDRFHLGAYVRKRSGAFWEGAVVGHYSTAQTSDGIAVQLFGWVDGPVQIYPAAALELCDHSNSRLPPPPQTHVAGLEDAIRGEGYVAGIAMSVAFLIRDRDEPSTALEWWRASGLTLDQCERANVDEYDMAPIRAALATTEGSTDA